MLRIVRPNFYPNIAPHVTRVELCHMEIMEVVRVVRENRMTRLEMRWVRRAGNNSISGNWGCSICILCFWQTSTGQSFLGLVWHWQQITIHCGMRSPTPFKLGFIIGDCTLAPWTADSRRAHQSRVTVRLGFPCLFEYAQGSVACQPRIGRICNTAIVCGFVGKSHDQNPLLSC